MTTSPLDRHRPTPAEDSILDFLSCLSQFRKDFTADIEIASNYLNFYEANWTPRMVTGSRSVRTSHPPATEHGFTVKYLCAEGDPCHNRRHLGYFQESYPILIEVGLSST
jgi:hypothetical protein